MRGQLGWFSWNDWVPLQGSGGVFFVGGEEVADELAGTFVQHSDDRICNVVRGWNGGVEPRLVALFRPVVGARLSGGEAR